VLIRLASTLLLAATVATACSHDRPQPAGGRFLVYTRHLSSDRQALWIANTDGSHRRLLVRHALFGAVSRDGRWVVFDRCLAARASCETGNAPFALFLISTTGGTSRLLARATSYPTWSPRSDRIVATRKGQLVTIDLRGNLRILEADRATAGWSFSPNGKWIVYAKARQHTKCGSDLFIVSATGGEKRRLTSSRDILPIWGRNWIAFSRYPKTCAYARRIWRIHPDGSNEQVITAAPPASSVLGNYYGFDVIGWTPDERTLLAGLATEWGTEAIRVDVATGAFRKLSGYALDLSRDGRYALVDSGGVEGPQTVAAVRLSDGRRQILARGDVVFPSWNR
jgi:Tol biopolymer transport system component